MQNLEIKRGQIYNVSDDPEHPPYGSEMWGGRPALIVSNDVNNKYSNAVEIVYLTTSPRRKKNHMPTHVMIKSGDKQAIALCEQITSVDKERIGNLIGNITDKEQTDIDRTLLLSLSISNTIYPTNIFKKWENYMRKYGLNAVQNSTDNSEIENIKKERDCYKSLYEAKCQQIQQLQNMVGKMI